MRLIPLLFLLAALSACSIEASLRGEHKTDEQGARQSLSLTAPDKA